MFYKLAIASAILFGIISAGSAAASEVVIKDAWARATADTRLSAAYMIISNLSATPVMVTSISSGRAGRTEIHETKVENNVASMHAVPNLTIQAGGTVTLAPRGLHIMLYDLASPFAQDEMVDLTLNFADGTTQTVMAEVR